MRKPRVVLVGPWPPTKGGVTTFMLNVESSYLAGKFEIHRYSTSRPPKKDVTRNYGYGAMFRGGIGRFLVGAAITALRLIWFPFFLLFRRPDVVQVQASDFQVFWEASLYVGWCRILRAPVLMRLGGSPNYFYDVSSERAKRLIRYFVRLPDKLIVQANVWRDFVESIGRKRDIVVLANSVPASLIVDHPRPMARPHCLFSAGTEAERKGSEEAIAAIKNLKSKGCDVGFRVVAATPSLQQRFASEGLADVELCGYLDREEMLAAMRSADIFLLPSWAEGFPNSLLEAMASGMACIVTPVGAIPEIVGSDGAIVVPVRDAGALADAIEKLVANPSLREQLSAQGQSIVRLRYTQDRVLETLECAWQSLLPAAAELRIAQPRG